MATPSRYYVPSDAAQVALRQTSSVPAMTTLSPLTSLVGNWSRAAVDASAVTPVVETTNGPIVGYITDGIQLSDDPFVPLRSAVYALSVAHRH